MQREKDKIEEVVQPNSSEQRLVKYNCFLLEIICVYVEWKFYFAYQ